MSEAPEEIWANEGLEWASFDCTEIKAGWTVRYIRADVAAHEIDRLRAALHRISLGAQDSSTTKDFLGKEARAATA